MDRLLFGHRSAASTDGNAIQSAFRGTTFAETGVIHLSNMKLNHVDLQVSDVSKARAFFEEHFGLRCTFQRREQLAILEDDTGLVLGVSNLFSSPPPVYPPDFHVGFILTSEPEVRAVYARLKEAGVELKTDLSRGGPNIYFMCVGPDRIVIEVRAPVGESQ